MLFRSRAGDAPAFAQLVTRWQERLWRHALRLTGSSESAWDALQESWLAIARGIPGLADPARFRRWSYTIVTRSAVNLVRQRAHERATAPETLDGHSAPSDDDDPSADEVARLRRALERLPNETRALVSLRYLEGLELAELAEVFGIPEGTVKSRLHHARAQLRAHLERKNR